MPRELIKNTGIYIIAGFFGQALISLLWIVLAWWLVPSQIGLYTLTLFVIEFFSVISIFGLDSAITRFYYAKEGISSIFNNALAIFLGSSFLSLLLFFFTAKLIPLFIPGLSNILEENLLLFGAVIFVNSVANFALVHYTALKKAISYAKLNLLKILFFCVFSLILIYFGFGILGVFYSLLFSSLLVAILFVVNERKIVSFQVVSPQIMKNITSYGFPLMLYSFLGVIVVYFSRLLLDRYTDLATLGVYSFFLMLTLQVNGLWRSFNQAWTPEIFSKFLEDRKKAIENVKFMAFLNSFIYLLIIVLFIIFGELFLFKLIFKEAYLSNIYIFYILLLAPLFTGIYTAAFPLYYYENKTKRVLFTSFILSVINISLTFFMVRFFSLIGAVLAYFVVAMLSPLIYLLSFKKIMQIPKKIINWTLFLSVLMIINVGVLLKTSSSILFVIFIIVGAVLAYKIGNLFEKRHLFSNFLKEIKTKIKPIRAGV